VVKVHNADRLGRVDDEGSMLVESLPRRLTDVHERNPIVVYQWGADTSQIPGVVLWKSGIEQDELIMSSSAVGDRKHYSKFIEEGGFHITLDQFSPSTDEMSNT
jgi:hypothetical protein